MNDEIVPEIAWQMGRPVRYGGEFGGFEERASYMARIAEEALAPLALEDSGAFRRMIMRVPPHSESGQSLSERSNRLTPLKPPLLRSSKAPLCFLCVSIRLKRLCCRTPHPQRQRRGSGGAFLRGSDRPHPPEVPSPFRPSALSWRFSRGTLNEAKGPL